jgi:hypothetical protein
MTADSLFNLALLVSLLIGAVTVWQGQQSIWAAAIRSVAMPLFITTVYILSRS